MLIICYTIMLGSNKLGLQSVGIDRLLYLRKARCSNHDLGQIEVIANLHLLNFISSYDSIDTIDIEEMRDLKLGLYLWRKFEYVGVNHL